MTPQRHNVLICLAWLLLQAADVHAVPLPGRIDVFLTRAMPLAEQDRLRQTLPDADINVHRIDTLRRIQSRLSHKLPADPTLARQVVLQRMQRLPNADSEALRASAEALLRAKQLGVMRYPAIVFDGSWVVYGVLDLLEAYERYRRYTKERRP